VNWRARNLVATAMQHGTRVCVFLKCNYYIELNRGRVLTDGIRRTDAISSARVYINRRI
jgi:hypothetical protein